MTPADGARFGIPAFPIPQNVVATVLDVLVASWRELVRKKAVNKGQSEPEIAGRLGQAMKAEKDRRGIRNLRIEEEVGTRSVAQPVKTDGRIDIKFIYSFEEREYFGLECKRVSGSETKLAVKYVTEGVRRFVESKYSTDHDRAALLGFVISGTCGEAAALVAVELGRQGAAMGVEEAWTAEEGFPGVEDLFRTRHRRVGSTVTLLHVFLSIN